MMGTDKSKRPDTKTHILDVAERLFAQNGFQRTSTRLLAQRAGVNQAAVNYHFGSKKALIEKIIERRFLPIKQLRMENLETVREAAERQGRKPDISDVLRAFIEPAFGVTERTQGERCILMMADRAFSEPADAIRNIFIRHFNPPFLLMLQLMKTALPGLPEEILWWRLHFVIGALVHCMRVCGTRLPVPNFSPPQVSMDSVVKLLITFVTNGMNGTYHQDNENRLGSGS